MGDYFDILTRARDLAPHGYCLLWQPELVWTHVVADALIAAAYFSIPIAIVRFVTGRKDIQFSWIFWLFALFIVACGTTHLVAIWTLWNADYGWQALIKVVTAIASVGTAIVLWPLIPKALAIPSPLQLREANTQLSERIRERDHALSELQREIADRERAEAALVQAQKMDAVGQLTGGIAHDFNNLLAVVIGSLDMIGRTTSEPGTKKRVQNALTAAERGARLTAQLLAFSRTQKLELRPTLVGPLLEQLRLMLNPTLGPSIAVNMRIDQGDVTVMADPTQLELAILNLAINARDAMPDGGTLSITTRLVHIADDGELATGEYLEIAVEDDGQGMTPEVAARAFDPFFTTKSVGQGTGLGLSMVYGVARQSGGTARIDSDPGRGTRVTLLLARTAAPAESPTEAPGPEKSAAGAAAAILVVDDDPDVRRILVDTLESVGHRVSSVGDGPAALQLIEQQQFDLLMLDYAMPGMSGAEVAASVRRIRPDQPILFVSGHADTAAIEAAAGNAGFLRKPFRTADIIAAVQRVLAI